MMIELFVLSFKIYLKVLIVPFFILLYPQTTLKNVKVLFFKHQTSSNKDKR